MAIDDIHDKTKEYCLVLLKRGPEYDMLDEEVQQQNQAVHLSYLTELRANGLLALTGPVMHGGHIVEIAIYNIADKQTVKALLENDPGVTAQRFTYEILTWFSVPGDALG